MTAPAAGAPAPDFSLPTTGGGTATLKDYAGRKLVLYFYPGDDGSTCTAEALDFTSMLAEFEAAGTAVLGVSPDSVASHEKFAKKRGLGVTLAADEDTSVCQAYGVWQQKQMYGRTYMGVVRTTFLIDAEGRIARAWTVSRVKGHVAEVLEAARAL
ncbi:peroxiredoxin [Kaistia geumhonensis]|uniref:thioredoxin-dependent peroxiredoxin n=1 Tax=Kaistia geumhonensis TaxID=410839 RepID=A0ABU0M277_9HYPH|nr:peroxiredoxin [Kaistia geumhonensis]MCX5479711.1 peroxiredoxin [Kaistia geumhonensis]MDQ0515065.1 peroxiredoxin Q/BCP [Kaistia geumhonensis]